jgi:hypothetical protein
MLAALCLAMVFAICLSSYIDLCYNSLKMSTRNLMSSHSIELAEAGLDQTLYSQNYNDWSAWVVTGSTATLTIPGFTFENGATGTIAMTVTNYGTNSPIYYSESFITLADGTIIKRALQASGKIATTFVNAAGTVNPASVIPATNATGIISFNGAGTVDSYDSSLGPYGGSGNPGGFSGVVLSQYSTPYGSNDGVKLNNAIVDGYVVGVGSSPVQYSSNAEIQGPSTPSTTMIDTSRILTETLPSQPQYQEHLPASGTPISVNLSTIQTMTLGSPTATVPTVYTVLGDVSLRDSAVLNITGPVILVVYGNLSINDSAQISIANTNITTGGGGPYVSLEVHLPNGSMNIDGGGIVNQSNSPERLVLMSTVNQGGTLEMGTLTPFYGVMDFPNNSLTIGGSQQIYGSLVAGALTFLQSPSLHYDMHLQSPMPLVAPNFMGPVYTAFQSTAGAGSAPVMTVSSVLEVAAL